MSILSWSLVLAGWCAWLYPFLFRAPHRQQRDSITMGGPTRLGLLLECSGILLAFVFRAPVDESTALARTAAALILELACVVMGWQAVAHLGRQFRVQAGLYHDHELVRSGPYGIVRHPIYTSMLGMLLGTVLLLTEWPWALLALGLFIAGTEIRVRAEDALLASRFGEDFQRYRDAVPAYIPFVR